MLVMLIELVDVVERLEWMVGGWWCGDKKKNKIKYKKKLMLMVWYFWIGRIFEYSFSV